jgi:hypothetical protein
MHDPYAGEQMEGRFVRDGIPPRGAELPEGIKHSFRRDATSATFRCAHLLAIGSKETQVS